MTKTQWNWDAAPRQAPQYVNSKKEAEPRERLQREAQGNRKNTGSMKLFLNLLKISLYMSIGIVVYFNVQPYIGIIALLHQTTNDGGLWAWLGRVPILGWLIGFFNGVWYHIWGTSLWAVFQLGELLPVILGTKTALKRTIVSFAKAERMEIKGTDSAVVASMKRQLNNAPRRWLQNATAIASICYIIDFGICMVYYPPVKNLSVFMAAPSLDQIDLRNCAFIVFTVLAVEAAVWVISWINQGIDYLQLRRQGGTA